MFSAFLIASDHGHDASPLRMYERMGFVRAPELDFHPAPDTTVKGYRLDVGEAG
jgi:hypothetical protein